MVIAFSSMGFAFHPSNLTSSGSQSFAESQGDSKGRSPWRAFGDFPRDGKVTRVQGGAPAGGCWGCQPRKNPRGAGRSARMVGAGAISSAKTPGRRAWQGHALAVRPLNPPLLFGIYRKEDNFFLSSTKTFCRNASPLCNTREIQKTLETAPFSSYNENRILPPGSLLHRAEEIGKTRRI